MWTDCWLSGNRTGIHELDSECACIRSRRCHRGCRSWLYSTLHGGSKLTISPYIGESTTDSLHRLSGYSISALTHNLLPAATSTPSPSTKNSAAPCAAVDPCLLSTTAAQRQRCPATPSRKCTPPLNSTASKPRRQSLDTLAVSQARRIATPHSHGLVGQSSSRIRLYRRPRPRRPWVGLRSITIREMTSNRRQSTRIVPRQYTHTKRIPTTRTRSVSRNTRS